MLNENEIKSSYLFYEKIIKTSCRTLRNGAIWQMTKERVSVYPVQFSQRQF